MHAAAFNAGASAVTSWLWQDQYYVWPLANATNGDSFYNGLHRWGVQPWLPYDAAVRPAYYALSALTRHFGPPPGAAAAASVTTGPASGGVAVAALKDAPNATGALGFRAVLLVNEGSTPATVSVTLSGYASAATLQRYCYDPATPPTDNQLLAPSGSYSGGGGAGAPLTDTLPARGVVVWSSAA